MTPVCAVPDPGRHPERKLVKLSRSVIDPDPDNPRKDADPKKLQELAGSIRANGQQVPALVIPHPTIPGRVLLVDGWRRWLALPLVPKDEMECIILAERPSPSQLRVIKLTLGATNEKLSPFEIADAATIEMRELKVSQAELASKIGMSPSKLCHCLKISAHTAQEIRPDIEAGLIPFSVAAMLARLKDNIPAQIDLAAKVKAGLLVRDAVEAEVHRLLSNGKKAPKRKPVKLPGKTLSMTLVGDNLNEAINEATRFITAAKKALSLNLPPESVPPLMAS